VNPPIYVSLGNINGGLVFNISEDGLALTTALNVADDHFLTMRIYLPDSRGWIEANGEIVWRGKSKKEGGVRFIGLAEDARQRISNWIRAEASHEEFHVKKDACVGVVGLTADSHQRIKNWIASEASRAEFHVRKNTSERPPGLREGARQRLRNWIFQEAPRREFGLAKGESLEKEEHPVGAANVHASSSSILESASPALLVEKQEQHAIAPADSDTRLGETEIVVAKPKLRHAQSIPGTPRCAPSALGIAERRARVRALVAPPIYINLGNMNGGLVFNMSEDGLVVTAALILAGDDPIAMRVQIPDSKGWMEVRGQIAWRGESKKTAGMRFVGLPEDSRERIREWLAAETLQSELCPEERILPKPEQPPSDDVPVETPIVPLPELLNSNKVAEKRMLEAILSEDPLASLDMPARVLAGPPRQSTQVATENLAPPRLPMSDMRGDKGPATAVATDALPREFSKRSEFKPKSRRSFHLLTSGTGTGRLRRLTAGVVLAGITAGALGWFLSSAARNEVIGLIGQNTERTNQPTEMKKLVSANKKNVPALRSENLGPQRPLPDPAPAHGRATDSETRLAAVRPQGHAMERPAARPTANGSVRRTEDPVLKSKSAKLSERTAVGVKNPPVENARSQAVKSLPARPMENTAAPTTSPSTSDPSGTILAEMKEKESPPPLLKQPIAPMAPTWSVAVSTDPYPSLRITPDISSKKALRGSTLQIGRAISHAEPVYPEDAKRQGIEGTVKLHLVVGRDGAVQSVESISGPALLAKAATSAVREWRYAQTMLGGQPVETEQEIVVKFRLVSPSISKN
jgi:protein TonB